ncbi:MAG: hypothetical protein ACOCRU_03075 [bacterium]
MADTINQPYKNRKVHSPTSIVIDLIDNGDYNKLKDINELIHRLLQKKMTIHEELDDAYVELGSYGNVSQNSDLLRSIDNLEKKLSFLDEELSLLTEKKKVLESWTYK